MQRKIKNSIVFKNDLYQKNLSLDYSRIFSYNLNYYYIIDMSEAIVLEGTQGGHMLRDKFLYSHGTTNNVLKKLYIKKIHDFCIQNARLNKLPEIKMNTLLIDSIKRLTVPKKTPSDSLVNILQMYGKNNVSEYESPVRTLTQSQKNIKIDTTQVNDELEEIAELLHNAVLLLQNDNPSLGDILSPEFQDLYDIGVLSTKIIKGFYSKKASYIISCKKQIDMKINSIMITCHRKNLKMKGLNTIKQQIIRVITLKEQVEYKEQYKRI
ncbi:MAG: hypothetical protein ACI9CD_000279 [Candidatus Deianiraeaceae bacterium]